MRNRLEIDDYVVAKRNINNIKKRSVGLVKNISGKRVTIFFIGRKKKVKTDRSYVAFLDIKKTGKPYGKKICNMCHLLKDNQEFSFNQTDSKGRKTNRPSCKECRADIDGIPLNSVEIKKLNTVKPKDLFTCPICKKTSIVGVTAKIVKDHDHLTGKSREWICDSCNTGLGRFKDDIKFLNEAIVYLEKYKYAGS